MSSCVLFFFVATLMLSSQSEERMLISQPPFKRIHAGIFETYKHFKNLASDVYTFLNRAAGVTLMFHYPIPACVFFFSAERTS